MREKESDLGDEEEKERNKTGEALEKKRIIAEEGKDLFLTAPPKGITSSPPEKKLPLKELLPDKNLPEKHPPEKKIPELEKGKTETSSLPEKIPPLEEIMGTSEGSHENIAPGEDGGIALQEEGELPPITIRGIVYFSPDNPQNSVLVNFKERGNFSLSQGETFSRVKVLKINRDNVRFQWGERIFIKKMFH